MENMMIRTETPAGATGTTVLTRGCASFGPQSGFGVAFMAAISEPNFVLGGRDRAKTDVKGHVGLVAYIPGDHAWSPPT